MTRLRNTIFLSLAFLAASLFLSVSVGGEFLHQHMHHHQTKVSHDECPFYQLLVQAFLFVTVVGLGVLFAKIHTVSFDLFVCQICPQFLLPGLRAPPVSL